MRFFILRLKKTDEQWETCLIHKFGIRFLVHPFNLEKIKIIHFQYNNESLRILFVKQ